MSLPSNDGVGGRPGRGLRGLAVAATAATFLLIAVGALVRATGSGLGCSGWPKCTPDRWLPPLQYHPIVEYTHRMTAFVDVVLIVALALVAWRRYRRVPTVYRPASAAAILVVFQAVLGGIVVEGDLKALLVTAHFMTAMVLAGTLVLATVGAFTIGWPKRTGHMDGLSRLAWTTVGSLFVLLAVGTYVRGEGAGLAFTDWPLMGGRVVPALGRLRPTLHFTHRALAVVVLCLVVWLAVQAWRGRASRPAPATMAAVATALFAAQIMAGAAIVWSRLATAAVTAHVALAGLVWGSVVAAAATTGLRPGPYLGPGRGDAEVGRSGSLEPSSVGPARP